MGPIVSGWPEFLQISTISLRLEPTRGIVLLSFTTLVAIRYRGCARPFDGGGLTVRGQGTGFVRREFSDRSRDEPRRS